jgi:hypothetical protein
MATYTLDRDWRVNHDPGDGTYDAFAGKQVGCDPDAFSAIRTNHLLGLVLGMGALVVSA